MRSSFRTHVRIRTAALLGAAVLFAVLPRFASAHAFGQSYVLPVPFWLYAYGAAAALVLSFIVIGYLADATLSAPVGGTDVSNSSFVRFFRSPLVLGIARALAVSALIATIAAGFLGVNSPTDNISMTLFWIIFLLGMAYAAAIFGDIWQAINPWRSLYLLYARNVAGVWRYPRWLGAWPALVAYAALIWYELIGGSAPFSLAVALSAYSTYVFLGAALCGERDWFANAEFLNVFFGFIARISPIRISGEGVRFAMPFSGLAEGAAQSMSEVCFILFMIASTSFDGFQETLPMLRLYLHAFSSVHSFDVFRTLVFIASPILLFGFYMLCVFAAKRITRSALPISALACSFAYALIPIAVAYNVAHYYTLLLVQGQNIFHLISDPLGYGWDLFGTAARGINIGIVQAGFIWHSQVAALLIGHIASVYLAHTVSLRIFETKKKALLAEVPMLILMVGFTVLGLWILSQPLGGS